MGEPAIDPESPVHRVVLEQVREIVRSDQIIDRDNLEPARLDHLAVYQAPDPSKPVDPDTNGHRGTVLSCSPEPIGSIPISVGANPVLARKDSATRRGDSQIRTILQHLPCSNHEHAMAVGVLKIWFWMQMDKVSLLREIKRMELQIARLTQRIK